MKTNVATLKMPALETPRSAQDVIALLELACDCFDRANEAMKQRIEMLSVPRAA
ncbi:hypothetical protein L2Y96_17920 [Luteibacter aegosomaticola]|uniref:hypothetical protein n=1 Tax=Luteibacter aegosomaticola TaxID=2911538 RepID=UPI001FFB463A|nr:hypothetical protein [Luteibacter aegosomaticola]UPG89256.1 hypothetical protein L2Y96_17920 [Luteibacter aegosomaticola]